MMKYRNNAPFAFVALIATAMLRLSTFICNVAGRKLLSKNVVPITSKNSNPPEYRSQVLAKLRAQYLSKDTINSSTSSLLHHSTSLGEFSRLVRNFKDFAETEEIRDPEKKTPVVMDNILATCALAKDYGRDQNLWWASDMNFISKNVNVAFLFSTLPDGNEENFAKNTHIQGVLPLFAKQSGIGWITHHHWASTYDQYFVSEKIRSEFLKIKHESSGTGQWIGGQFYESKSLEYSKEQVDVISDKIRTLGLFFQHEQQQPLDPDFLSLAELWAEISGFGFTVTYDRAGDTSTYNRAGVIAFEQIAGGQNFSRRISEIQKKKFAMKTEMQLPELEDLLAKRAKNSQDEALTTELKSMAASRQQGILDRLFMRGIDHTTTRNGKDSRDAPKDLIFPTCACDEQFSLSSGSEIVRMALSNENKTHNEVVAWTKLVGSSDANEAVTIPGLAGLVWRDTFATKTEPHKQPEMYKARRHYESWQEKLPEKERKSLVQLINDTLESGKETDAMIMCRDTYGMIGYLTALKISSKLLDENGMVPEIFEWSEIAG